MSNGRESELLYHRLAKTELASPTARGPLVAGDEYRRLTAAAELAARGAFLVALGDDETPPHALLADLALRLAPLPVYTFPISAAQPAVPAYLHELPPAKRHARAVVAISGLQSAGDVAARHLEMARDYLADHPHTLLLWLPGDGRRWLAEHAPNLYSRHGGVFDLRTSRPGR